VQDTIIGERISNSIQHKDVHNQESKHFVGEASGQTNYAGQVKEASEDCVEEQEDGDPCVEGKERYIHAIAHGLNSTIEGNHGAGGTNDALKRYVSCYI